jgi:hypothetical protein
MMRIVWALFLLAAAAALLPGQMPSCSLVPGWQQEGEARTFDADNLFEYMDGNAEGYVIYDFVRMHGVTCKKDGVTLVFDVSEMAGGEFAYGIFMANRDPNRPVEKIGTAGQIMPRRGVFCKDKYYVEIAANPEGDHTEILRQFLRAMEARIPGEAKLPDLLTWFPREGLDEATLRLVPQSVLGLSLLKRGYVGQYPYGRMFIVTEASPESAAEVLKKANARMGETAKPVAVGDEGFQATDKYLGRLCFFRKGRYVAGIAGVPESDDPVARAKALASRIP